MLFPYCPIVSRIRKEDLSRGEMAARTPDQQCSIPTASISTASPPGGCTREGVALMTAPCSTKIITTAHGDIEQIPTESVALTKRVASTGCCGNSFKPSGPVDICCDPLVRPNPISCGKSVRRLVQSDLVGVACSSPGEARCRERGDSCETGSAPCDEKFEEMGLERASFISRCEVLLRYHVSARFAEASLSKEELCPCCLPLILDCESHS